MREKALYGREILLKGGLSIKVDLESTCHQHRESTKKQDSLGLGSGWKKKKSLQRILTMPSCWLGF